MVGAKVTRRTLLFCVFIGTAFLVGMLRYASVREGWR